MNGQQLFFCFLPGVTLFVLTSYPSLADTVKVSEPQLVVSPTLALDSIYVSKLNDLPQQIVFNNTFATKTINQQVLFQFEHDVRAVSNPSSAVSGSFIASSPKDLVSAIKNQTHTPEKPVDANVLLALVGLYGEESHSLSFTNFGFTDFGFTNFDIGANENSSEPTDNLNKVNLSPSVTNLPVTKKTIATPTLTIAQLPPSKAGASSLKPVPLQKEAELIAQNRSGQQKRQPATVQPGKVPASEVQIPGLNSNPNPLQFPTKPGEVEIRGTQPITLNQALETARRNSNQLQVQILTVERSQAAVREAQAALLPTLGLNATITRSRSAGDKLSSEAQIRRNPALANQIPGAEESTGLSGNAQLSYDLYTSGRRQATIRQAEEQLRFDELNLEVQSETIRLNVTTQYYDLQQADESVRINREAVVNAQASLRDAQALERAGVGTRFDVLQFQVDLANSQQQLTNSISQQQIAQRQLKATLNIPQPVNLSAADPVAIAGLWNQTLDQSIILALQNRPELQQQLAQRSIGEQQRRQALSTLGPQISLVAQYNLLDQFQDQIPVVDGYSVGVQASLNLYEGGAARARASQASKAISIAETQFAEQRNQIRFQVEQAFLQLGSNLQNVQTANVALNQATEALRLARLRFQAGVGTQTDVINAQNRLTQSEGNRVTAILSYNRALAAIQRAVTTRSPRQ